ncbi:MAG TPA: hypothetical protein VLM80_02780 [Anaerolineales bacterium]|nr:hypothetical protein [Anaerolineales bacterium]
MPGENAGGICKQISEIQKTVMVLGKAAYDRVAATEPGGPEHPGDIGHTTPHSEDLVEGEYSKM